MKNKFFESKESPFEVIKTIIDVSFAQNAMKGLTNLISEEQKNETRKLLNIEPKRMNNYKPEEEEEETFK